MMRRFCCYIDEVFDFGDRVGTLRDERQRPRIPTSAIWMSAFAMFAMHRGSLNAIELELRVPKRWMAWWVRTSPEPIESGMCFV